MRREIVRGSMPVWGSGGVGASWELRFASFRLAGGFLLGLKLSEAASYRHVLSGEWNLECPRLGGALSSSIFFKYGKEILMVFEIVLGEFRRCAFTLWQLRYYRAC